MKFDNVVSLPFNKQKAFQAIFHETLQKYKASLDDVQTTSSVTFVYIFPWSYSPLKFDNSSFVSAVKVYKHL